MNIYPAAAAAKSLQSCPIYLEISSTVQELNSGYRKPDRLRSAFIKYPVTTREEKQVN